MNHVLSKNAEPKPRFDYGEVHRGRVFKVFSSFRQIYRTKAVRMFEAAKPPHTM